MYRAGRLFFTAGAILALGFLVSLSLPTNENAMLERVAESVVDITSEGDSLGTGFAANEKIYTCFHVIADTPKTKIWVRSKAGRIQPAKLIRVNIQTDLAELGVKHPPRSLEIRLLPPAPRERVYQIGNPGALLFVESSGQFAGFAAGGVNANFFLIDTWFGNSGSPIVDAGGRVMGITHAILSGSRFTNAGTLADLRAFIYPNRPR